MKKMLKNKRDTCADQRVFTYLYFSHARIRAARICLINTFPDGLSRGYSNFSWGHAAVRRNFDVARISKNRFSPLAHFSTDYTGPEPGYNTKVWNKTTALTKPISIYQPRQGLIRSANLSTLNRPGTRYDVTMRSVLWSGYLRPVRSLCCNMLVDS